MAVALLLAAGRGERLGGDAPKALAELAGRPLLQWSLDVLAGCDAVAQIVLTLPDGLATLPDSVALPSNALCVPGGAVRSASVRLALAAAGPGDPVLVHDSARPLLSAELVKRTLATVEVEGIDAAVAAAPVTDTIKRTTFSEPTTVSAQSAASRPPARGAADLQAPMPLVVETLDRSNLWAVQTPQVFRRKALERALDVSDEILAQATDDAWLIERSGGRVAIVASDPENLKVTSAADLALAELLLSRRHSPAAAGSAAAGTGPAVAPGTVRPPAAPPLRARASPPPRAPSGRRRPD
jgi:2-C-methyl-D-erythritol 4-phosphate cytidylyltransferase